MRGLMALVVGMGVLIVVGLLVVVVTLVRRHGAGPVAVAVPTEMALHEPAGTHIATVVAVGERLAVLLQGGGADRVVFVDAAHGVVVGHLTLAPVAP